MAMQKNVNFVHLPFSLSVECLLYQYVIEPMNIPPLGPHIDSADGANQLQIARTA